MDPEKNYLMVGIFVVIFAVGISLFAVWLTSHGKKDAYRPFQIHFAESVNGLSIGSPVRYRGVEVGSVRRIKIDHDDARTVKVVIIVLKGTPIKSDTFASLKMQGITGTSYVNLEGGSVDLPDLVEGENGEPPQIPAKFSNLTALMNQAPELMNRTLALVERAENMLSEKNIGSVTSILEHWDRMSGVMEEQASRLDAVVTSTTHMMQSLDQTVSQIEGSNINQLLENLRATSENLKNFSSRTDKAAKNSYEDVSQLLTEVKKASREIRELTRKLGDNPSQIIYPPKETGVKVP